MIRTAWAINPLVAIQLRLRFINSADQIETELAEVSYMRELSVVESTDAVSLFLKNAYQQKSDEQLRVIFIELFVTRSL